LPRDRREGLLDANSSHRQPTPAAKLPQTSTEEKLQRIEITLKEALSLNNDSEPFTRKLRLLEALIADRNLNLSEETNIEKYTGLVMAIKELSVPPSEKIAHTHDPRAALPAQPPEEAEEDEVPRISPTMHRPFASKKQLLAEACKEKNWIDISDLLRKHDIDVTKFKGEDGNTLMHISCLKECPPNIYNIIRGKITDRKESKEDIAAIAAVTNHRNAQGLTAFHLAFESRLSIKPEDREQFEMGNLVSPPFLADPNAPLPVGEPYNGLPPLHYACEIGDIQMVNHLLALSSPPQANINTAQGTALHAACRSKNVALLEIFFNSAAKYKIDINARDMNGNTALHIVAQLMIDLIPSIENSKGKKNATIDPLQEIAQLQELRELLVANRAKLDKKNNNKEKKLNKTPKELFEIFEKAMQKKKRDDKKRGIAFKLDCAEAEATTPALHMACLERDLDMLKILLDLKEPYQSDIDARDAQSNTAAHIVANMMSSADPTADRMMALLEQYGADLHLENRSYQSPTQLKTYALRNAKASEERVTTVTLKKSEVTKHDGASATGTLKTAEEATAEARLKPATLGSALSLLPTPSSAAKAPTPAPGATPKVPRGRGLGLWSTSAPAPSKASSLAAATPARNAGKEEAASEDRVAGKRPLASFRSGSSSS